MLQLQQKGALLIERPRRHLVVGQVQQLDGRHGGEEGGEFVEGKKHAEVHGLCGGFLQPGGNLCDALGIVGDWIELPRATGRARGLEEGVGGRDISIMEGGEREGGRRQVRLPKGMVQRDRCGAG